MEFLAGVTKGVCPYCRDRHPVRRAQVMGGHIAVMDSHRVSDSGGWCRGEGLAPEFLYGLRSD